MEASKIEILKKNFDFFMANLDDLSGKYMGRFLLIKDEAVVKDFGTELEAYKYGVENMEAGTFIIQECKSADKDSYVQTFRSRVRFHNG